MKKRKKENKKSNRGDPGGRDKIKILAFYLTEVLQKVVGKRKEVFYLPEGSRSGDFFDFIEEKYPELFKKFGPGYLGFTLNGKKPHVLTRLQDGDVYKFTVWTEEEIAEDDLVEELNKSGALVELPKGELKMPAWMDCTWRRVPCGKWGCNICGKIQ